MRQLIVFFVSISSFFSSTAQVLQPEQIYSNTVNSTVTIETGSGIGSGFFVEPDVIATNYHVIDGATEAVCKQSNKNIKYKIEGYLAVDENADLALLKVSGLKGIPVPFESEDVKPGQAIFVIGSPKGLSATISDGIVSGLREIDGMAYVQISAPISPGSSGGPVLNNKGKLIGISVMQLKEGQNLNFAIPVSSLKGLMQLKKTIAHSLASLKKPADPQSESTGSSINTPSAYVGKKFIREKIEEWGECRNVCITSTASIALKGRNSCAWDGTVPDAVISKLKALNQADEFIDDVQLTENGNWLIQFGENGYSSYGLPASLIEKMKAYNESGEVILSVSFNDGGEWVLIGKTKYNTSSQSLTDFIKAGAEKFGMVWSAHLTEKSMVVSYEGGYKFLGKVPELLKKRITESRLDVYKIKFTDDGYYFFADRKGAYAYFM